MNPVNSEKSCNHVQGLTRNSTSFCDLLFSAVPGHCFLPRSSFAGNGWRSPLISFEPGVSWRLLRKHDRRRSCIGGSIVALVDPLPGAQVGTGILIKFRGIRRHL